MNRLRDPRRNEIPMHNIAVKRFILSQMVDYSQSPIHKTSSVAQNIDSVEIRPSYFHNHSTENIIHGSELQHYLVHNDSQSSSLSDASNYEGGIF